MPQMSFSMNSVAGVTEPLAALRGFALRSPVTEKVVILSISMPGIKRHPSSMRRSISSRRAKGVGPRIISAKLSSREDDYDSTITSPSVTGLVASSIMITALADGDAAQALSKQEVTDAYVKGEEIVVQVAKTAGEAFETGKGVFNQVVKTVKPGLEAALPFVKKTADSVAKFASPIASDLVGGAKNALKNAGVNPDPGVEFAKTAAEQTSLALKGAQPIGSSALDSALHAGPLFLAEAAAGLIAFYFLAPVLVSSIVNSARGYAADLTAAQALDLLLTEDYSLIDIRTEKEKYRSGVPSLPGNAKNKYVALPIEEFAGRVKSQLRNSRKVEAEVAAIKIASLKKLNKGSKVALLDESNGVAKAVARALKKLGFKNIFVITDGFNGGKGWVQSRLGTDNYTSSGPSFVEILSPSRIIPAGTKSSSTSSSRGFNLLPGGVVDE